MINLKIYGRLRKFIGKSSFEIEANSPRKAFNFLIACNGLSEIDKNSFIKFAVLFGSGSVLVS